MKSFKFKQFEIQQSENVFRVGTDGVLLGVLADVEKASNVLEIGTGTGLITLMLAQRNPKAAFLGLDINEDAVALTKTNFKNAPFQIRLRNIHQDFKSFDTQESEIGTGTGLITLMLAQRNPKAAFLGLDINEDAVALTKTNFKNAPFQTRLRNIHQDFKSFDTQESFDLIVSNPPYFEESASDKDKMARQTVELNFKQLISQAAGLLSETGLLSVIIPSEAGEVFTSIAKENSLFLSRRVNITGIENSKVKRLVLEFSLQEKNLEESDFTIEKSPRQYSDQYLELTKEFHVFNRS